nr:hypothetical protein [Tanacetum cinerariifolium]
MFDCDNYYSSESDCENWPHSSLYDRFQPSGGYHDVPSLITGTFMPPKPDLLFNTAPTAVETNHHAFNLIETFILAATPAPANLKSTSSGKRRNRKTCFIYKSVDHLIKDYDYHAKKMAQPTQRNYAHMGDHKQYASFPYKKPQKHMVPTAVLTQSKPVFNTAVRPSVDHLIKECDYHAKKMAQPTPRNYAHRGNHKQYASLTHTNPPKHIVPAAMLTQYKLVYITAVRPVSAAMPKLMVTRPRLAHPIVTISKSPIRRHITRRQSPKTSNSPPRVTAVQAPVVCAAPGMQGNWGTCPIYLTLRSLMVDMLPLEVIPRVVRFLVKEKLRQLSPTKPAQDMSHTNRPTASIIEDWVSDSEDESETKAPQIVPSFVQSF